MPNHRLTIALEATIQAKRSLMASTEALTKSNNVLAARVKPRKSSPPSNPAVKAFRAATNLSKNPNEP